MVLTDQNQDNRTGFVLSKKGFSAMARKGNIQKLLNLTSIDVEYKRSVFLFFFFFLLLFSLLFSIINPFLLGSILTCRIPCDYKNKNLTIFIQDWSKVPYYFSIKFLYQGGQTQILAVKIAQVT